MSHLGKKALLDLAVPLTKDVLPKLATKATSSVLDKFERKISGKAAVRAEKGFTLFISNGNMDDIIKIVESLEKSSLLTDGATETVKHEIKKRWIFLGYYITYNCIIDSTYGFFIDTTCGFFIDKCCNWKRTRRWISSIIRIIFNGDSPRERSQKIRKWI